MVTLLVSILPLALGAAVSPTLLMVEVFALSAKTSPVAKGWLVALGATLMLALYGAIGFVIGSSLPHEKPHHGIDGAIAVIAAVLLGWLVIRQFMRRNATSSKPTLSQRLDSASGKVFFFSGVIVMLTNFSTLILFLPAIRLITKAHAVLPDKGLSLVVLMLIALSPVLVPVLVVTILGSKANAGLTRLNDFVTRRSLAITMGIETIFFVYFVVKAILELKAL